MSHLACCFAQASELDWPPDREGKLETGGKPSWGFAGGQLQWNGKRSRPRFQDELSLVETFGLI